MVSIQLAVDRIRDSRVVNVARVAEMVHAHEADLARFIKDDPQGKLLPDYLKQLAAHLITERAALLTELESVNKNAEHIKHVISVQQEFAGAAHFVQATDFAASSTMPSASRRWTIIRASRSFASSAHRRA